MFLESSRRREEYRGKDVTMVPASTVGLEVTPLIEERGSNDNMEKEIAEHGLLQGPTSGPQWQVTYLRVSLGKYK